MNIDTVQNSGRHIDGVNRMQTIRKTLRDDDNDDDDDGDG
jgi:hypothetical protein